jgi:large subunit ribosomal protein L23
MTTIYEVLRRPIITEKSNFQSNYLNQYVFEVANDASKKMIKEAVESIFEVSVQKIRIVNVPARRTRRARSRRVLIRRQGFKKAVITLAPGDRIAAFEGVQ